MAPFVGQIILVAFDFAPPGWAICNGQSLPIAENETLFQLIGTTYGGDGEETFALPDLRGRLPIGIGQGAGLQNYAIGEFTGTENLTLTLNQLPAHSHAVSTTLNPTARCRNGVGDQSSPKDNVVAADSQGRVAFSNADPDISMNPETITVGGGIIAGAVGGAQAHSNLQPYLGLHFCISLFGVFPSPG